MTRDQAKAIIENLQLIKHFAYGGDIGFRLIDCHGKDCGITPAHTITISNLKPNSITNYVMVKPKYKITSCNMPQRIIRYWPDKIQVKEIITCNINTDRQ